MNKHNLWNMKVSRMNNAFYSDFYDRYYIKISNHGYLKLESDKIVFNSRTNEFFVRSDGGRFVQTI